MRFFARLADRIEAVDSVVSVGLDPAPDRLPPAVADAENPRWAFNRRIVDATHEHAACYKCNAAFYEDPAGWRALEETVAYAHGKDVPVLLDGKRADVGHTARQYASVLDDVDAVTVTPYMGQDAVEPFRQRTDAGVFVLCRTSNTGGADVQDRELADGRTVYELVADLVASWDADDNLGLVVGATAPDELAAVRERVPDLPFLVPGVGAQGGAVEAAVEYGLADGVGLVNSSRGIIFAGEDAGGDGPAEGEAFFRAAGAAAKRLRKRLNEYR